MNQDRSTSSAVLFGLMLAMCYVVLRVSLGPTLGIGAFLLLIGLQMLATAWLPWSRLGLRWTSLAMFGNGCGLLAGGSFLMLQPDPARLRLDLLLPLVAVLLASSALLLIDRRSSPEAWDRWRRGLEGASPVDILLGRHFSKAG